jgi:SsrA-binding protein
LRANRKAYHDYLIEDTFEAGMVLSGTEVKSLRAGRASLVDGSPRFAIGEIWLEGVHIAEYTEGTWNNHAPRRRRKLLLNRHEIAKLVQKTKESGHTIVPLSMYFKDGYAKVEIALAKASAPTTSGRPCGQNRTSAKRNGPSRHGGKMRPVRLTGRFGGC